MDRLLYNERRPMPSGQSITNIQEGSVDDDMKEYTNKMMDHLSQEGAIDPVAFAFLEKAMRGKGFRSLGAEASGTLRGIKEAGSIATKQGRGFIKKARGLVDTARTVVGRARTAHINLETRLNNLRSEAEGGGRAGAAAVEERLDALRTEGEGGLRAAVEELAPPSVGELASSIDPRRIEADRPKLGLGNSGRMEKSARLIPNRRDEPMNEEAARLIQERQDRFDRAVIQRREEGGGRQGRSLASFTEGAGEEEAGDAAETFATAEPIKQSLISRLKRLGQKVLGTEDGKELHDDLIEEGDPDKTAAKVVDKMIENAKGDQTAANKRSMRAMASAIQDDPEAQGILDRFSAKHPDLVNRLKKGRREREQARSSSRSSPAERLARSDLTDEELSQSKSVVNELPYNPNEAIEARSGYWDYMNPPSTAGSLPDSVGALPADVEGRIAQESEFKIARRLTPLFSDNTLGEEMKPWNEIWRGGEKAATPSFGQSYAERVEALRSNTGFAPRPDEFKDEFRGSGDRAIDPVGGDAPLVDIPAELRGEAFGDTDAAEIGRNILALNSERPPPYSGARRFLGGVKGGSAADNIMPSPMAEQAGMGGEDVRIPELIHSVARPQGRTGFSDPRSLGDYSSRADERRLYDAAKNKADNLSTIDEGDEAPAVGHVGGVASKVGDTSGEALEREGMEAEDGDAGELAHSTDSPAAGSAADQADLETRLDTLRSGEKDVAPLPSSDDSPSSGGTDSSISSALTQTGEDIESVGLEEDAASIPELALPGVDVAALTGDIATAGLGALTMGAGWLLGKVTDAIGDAGDKAKAAVAPVLALGKTVSSYATQFGTEG